MGSRKYERIGITRDDLGQRTMLSHVVLALLLQIATTSLVLALSSSTSSPKYLFYNIYLGGQDRLNDIAQWVRSGNYNVAAFSELNGFEENTWSDFCVHSLNMSHSIFLKTKHGYHMGIASSMRMEPLLLRADKPFHHGIIYAWIPDLKHAILVAHLSPTSAYTRLLEMREVTSVIKAANHPTLVVGDMNTLSPRDKVAAETLDVLRSTQRLREKFLVDDASAVDYRPMSHALNSGLIDLGEGSNDKSVPTRLEVDKMHAAPMRLDFALATPSFLNLRKENGLLRARTLSDKTTNILSDHLPLCISSAVQETELASSTARDDL